MQTQQVNTSDLHATKRDVKVKKRRKPMDNRKSIRLIANLSKTAK